MEPGERELSPRGPRRRWRAPLAVALTLAVAELALRAVVADWAWIDVLDFGPRRGACFGLAPGAEGTYEGVWRRVPATRIRVDARGLREDVPPRDGALRVLMMGDSHVFGLGSAVEDTLARRLAGELSARGGGPVAVINAGVPGYDLPKEIDELPRLVEALRPDRILFLLDPNDLVRVPCAWWKNHTRPALRASALLRGAYLFLAGRARPQEPTPEDVAAGLSRELPRLRAAAPVPVTIAMLGPLPAGGDEALASRGVGVVQLSDEVEAMRADEARWTLQGEGHFNAAGNARLARRLARDLAARGFLAR